MFKLGWGHRTKFYEVVEAEGGTPHISNWNIWSNVQIRVGTPQKFYNVLKTEGERRTFQFGTSGQIFKIG